MDATKEVMGKMSTRIHTPPRNCEVTLLALGDGYGLYGDKTGRIGRICSHCLTAVKVRQPMRIYLEDETEQADFFGFPVEVSADVPKDTVIATQNYKDDPTGLGVRAAFDTASGTWYVQELRDNLGRPTGRFFSAPHAELAI